MSGYIEVITGPMFAGKTEELIRRIKRLEYAKKNIVVLKPTIDKRYSIDEIVSHSNLRTKSYTISSSSEIMKYVYDDTYAVIIDEVQFLDMETPNVLNELANQGKRVIVSGLDKDFRGEPFGNMPSILAMAESVTKLTAICVKCGENATCTQRIINGLPARYTDEIVLVGAKESYEPRCRKCHEVIR